MLWSRISDGEIERHIPALRRFARSLVRDRDAADDLVQETLLKAVSRWTQLRKSGSLRPWLFQILYNVARARFRKARFVEVDMPADTDREHPRTIGHSDEGIELRSALDALAQLPEDQRIVLELVAIEGLTYEEVSHVVDVPVGTVMSRLSRGREKLRSLLGESTQTRLRRVK